MPPDDDGFEETRLGYELANIRTSIDNLNTTVEDQNGRVTVNEKKIAAIHTQRRVDDAYQRGLNKTRRRDMWLMGSLVSTVAIVVPPLITVALRGVN